MRKNILYIMSSVFFSFILFIYANSIYYQNNSNSRQTASETYTNIVSNVPIDIQYDNEKYFISGFASEVSVELTGSNRVTLASEMQESTRNFKVIANLIEVPIGTKDVPLSLENLPSGLTGKVVPGKITVKIGKKVSKNFPVKAIIDNSQVREGYEIEKSTLVDTKVKVTSDEDTLSEVDHVEAILPASEMISGNTTLTVPLQAVDADGNVLASVISPYETTVKVMVKMEGSSSTFQ